MKFLFSAICRSFLLLLLLLNACKDNDHAVHVSSTSFEGEVAQLQNLGFFFNKDLVPDSCLHRWDSTEYLSFTPAVRGLFKWNNPGELIFSPMAGFEPGTEYSVTLMPGLLKKAAKGYHLQTGKNDIRFYTAPLRVQRANLSWTQGNGTDRIVTQLELVFNYEVDVTEAASKLKLQLEGQSVPFATQSSGTGRSLLVWFALPGEARDEEIPLDMSLGKGIAVTGSKYVSSRDTSFREPVPSRFNLTVTAISAQHTGAGGVVTLSTSQPVREERLRDKIKIYPEIPFEVETNEIGLTVSSASFKPDQTYNITVSASLEGAFGGRMKQDYTGQAIFGKLDPSVRFVNTKGVYISSAGNRNLALNIVSVPAVRVSVIKVYENNLEFFLSRYKRYGYHYDDETDEGGSYEYYDTENLGDTIFSRDYNTDDLPGQNAARILNLNFQDKIKDYDGIYVVTVASKDHNWVQDSRIISVSDIGLIVKQERDNIYVFANSILHATPMAGVSISFISTNNQKMHTVTTDNEGVAVFRDISKKSPGFRAGLITAKLKQDFSFIWLQQSRIETSRFDVGGRIPNHTGLNAWIYAERNLYRPGETISVSTVVRDESWNIPSDIPVKLRLKMPNGKEFATLRKMLGAEGSCEASFAIPHTALTGTYMLEVLSGNDVLLNSYAFSIEEFMPDRIKAEVATDRQEYQAGDTVSVAIRADNLFGTPAVGRNYDCELTLTKEDFKVKELPDYTFSISNNFSYESIFRQGKTDGQGTAREEFPLSQSVKDAGLLKGSITSSVFDETGRPVHRFAHFTVFTQSAYLGIKELDYYTAVRKPMHIGLVATDKNGKVKTGQQAQVTVLKKEWNTVIEQSGSRYKYVSRKQEKVLTQKTVSVSGTGTRFSFTPELSGEYEVRLALPGSNGFVSRTFYAWGWAETEYSSFEVNNEGHVSIKPDKDQYTSGETMRVLFTTPFEGRMLVTLERDKILKHYYLNTKDKSASLDIKTDDHSLPNVYITATLFRPMDGSDMPLTVAHGFRNVMVERPAGRIPVALQVAEQSRSAMTQKITVKTEPGAYVTIAAVDEGILQVRNYKSPDPHAYFYQKVALTTGSFDIYPLLLPELKTTRKSTGGDGGDGDQHLRVNPLFVNRVKNVSFWSGIRQADSRGNVQYEISIPRFSGSLRVMAVAYKGKGFGGADHYMKVADPVVVSAALPRFFSPNDEAVMPVTLSNTTGKDAVADVEVLVAGPLGVSGQSREQVRIPAHREARATFNIKAGNAIGAGKVTVKVKALNETFLNETDISVRPPASLQKRTGNGMAEADKTTTVRPEGSFLPETASGWVLFSRSPLVEFSNSLSDLVQYPHGCAEQTVSRAFPQLYYHDLVKTFSSSSSEDGNPGYNVREAILKLQSMQLSNGALAYWPGGGSESWWSSIYAAHFLLEAQKAGFEVNTGTVGRLLQYLKNRLQKRETEIYYYNKNLKKEIAAKEIAYSLYILALAGQPQMATMNYYKGNPDMLALDSKYMLAAAYGIAGNKAQAMQVLPAEFSGEESGRSFGGSFYSYIRDMGVALNALLELDPGHKQVAPLARRLSEQLRSARYLSTQEQVWGILAIGKIARTTAATTSEATVTIQGKPAGTVQGKDIKVSMNAANRGKPVQLQVKGKGPWYYFWEMKGITADGGYLEEDNFIKVRRTYFDRNGTVLSGNSFRQNDLIVVQIALSSQYNGTIENVVVTDMLPAGFEIENARLTELPQMQWIKNETHADYSDIRDDRINLFTTLDRTTQYFYYMVRAVSPGVYQQGPVQADAMYNGEYHSYHGAGKVVITAH